jgi:NADH:ubiquinone oxidoreductase subunit 6 (subunit J)
MNDIVFWLFCLLTLGGGVYVLLSKHVLYAAYGLLVTFLGVAGIFVFSGAELMAAAQIMIYVGGIMILLVFGIMLSARKRSEGAYLEVDNAGGNKGLWLAILMAAVWLVLVTKLVFIGDEVQDLLSIKRVGYSLMTTNVLVLEIIGVLLLMALVGATYIAKDEQ